MTTTDLTPRDAQPGDIFRRGDYTADRDGWLFIVSQDMYDLEPVMYRNWYPTGVRVSAAERSHGKPIVGVWSGAFQTFTWTDAEGYEYSQEAMLDYGSGVYQLLRKQPGYMIDYLRLDIKETDGRKIAVAQDFIRVPRPPARGKELRWYRGGWQRLLAKGWVSA